MKKINAFGVTERSTVIGSDKPSVVVSSNPIRIREMLDKEGNVIDPRTKQIIRRKDAKEENQ